LVREIIGEPGILDKLDIEERAQVFFLLLESLALAE